jgi:hypothetical protein
VIGENTGLYRKWCIHLSHQWSGWRLEEIGAHFGMRGAAVSQMSRRFRKRVERDRSMGKLLERIRKELLIVDRLLPKSILCFDKLSMNGKVI